MAAPPVPVLCSASPCRVATHLAPPAFRTVAVARPQALPFVLSVEQRVGPSARARAPFAAKRGGGGEVSAEAADGTRALLQAALWGAEAAYILWLFLLPYAPVSKSVPVSACICVPNYELKRCHHRVPSRETLPAGRKKKRVCSFHLHRRAGRPGLGNLAGYHQRPHRPLTQLLLRPAAAQLRYAETQQVPYAQAQWFFFLSLSQSYCGRDSVGEFSWAV
jgi:hypothetical protein